jgi:hypothetical protein
MSGMGCASLWFEDSCAKRKVARGGQVDPFPCFPSPWKIDPCPLWFEVEAHFGLAGISLLTIPILPVRAAPIVRIP